MSIDRIRNNFLLFAQNMEPEFKFAKVHKVVCGKVESTITAHDGRLLLAVPPGFGKSTLCSRMLPAWILGNNPKAKILLLTYGAKLSDDHGKACRRYMNTPQYKKIFPQVVIEGDGLSGTFSTTEGGGLRAVGRGGSITGFRCNYLILDDTLKNNKEAQSDTILNNLHDWFSTTALSRLLPGGSVVGFNTRWAERDLIGYILDNYQGWDYLNLPALATHSGADDLLGRNIGESLWEEYYPRTMLEEIKEATPETFGALYQGNPVNAAATPIKLSSLVYQAPEDFRFAKRSRVVCSWDTASSQDKGDYTICTIWKVSKDYGQLVAVERAQVAFEGLLDMFNVVQRMYKPTINIVENASSGRQLIQLNPELCLPSQTIKADDKMGMAKSLNSSLALNKLGIAEGLLTPADMSEITSFPYGKHDDLVLSILHFYKNYLSNELHTFKSKTNSSVLNKLKRSANYTAKRNRVKPSRGNIRVR